MLFKKSFTILRNIFVKWECYSNHTKKLQSSPPIVCLIEVESLLLSMLFCFLLLPPIDNAQSSFAGSWHPAQVKLWLTQFIRLKNVWYTKHDGKRSIFPIHNKTWYLLIKRLFYNNHSSERKTFRFHLKIT